MSPLFITCFQHESTVFTSLEITSFCETLAQFKKLNLTFSSALRSPFPNGLARQDSKRSNGLCEAAVEHKLSPINWHRCFLHLPSLQRPFSCPACLSPGHSSPSIFTPSERDLTQKLGPCFISRIHSAGKAKVRLFPTPVAGLPLAHELS